MGNGLSPATTVDTRFLSKLQHSFFIPKVLKLAYCYLRASDHKQLIATVCLPAHPKRQCFIFSASVTLETLVNVLIFIWYRIYVYTFMNEFVVQD
jgi:hypothetical protein